MVSWRVSAAAKAAEQDARIGSLSPTLFMTETETEDGKRLVLATAALTSIEQDLDYLRASASEIATNIKSRKTGWTAERVLEAYVRSALRAHKATNCLTEMMFLPAFERARQLDKQLEETGKVQGPLHGVPVSLKDQFEIQGEDATIGFTHLLGKPSSKTATTVQLLIDAGAVPFTKTNVPQTMLSFECANPLFGFTHNPYKHGFGCGGSSGGEAALLAADGSPLGMGSDIGGSLRIPGHYSGSYGLKPCYGRFPNAGAVSPSPGLECFHSSIGPMGRCVDDLVIASRTILSAVEKHWNEENLIPLPWREDKLKIPSKLRFGYYANDEVAKASPPCQRAVKETIAALEKQGHEVVPVDVSKLRVVEAIEIFVALTSADGYETLLSGLHGDPRESSLFLTTLGPRLPWPIRSTASFMIKKAAGDEVMGRLIGASRKKDVKETYVWQHKRDELAEAIRRYLWKELKLDAVICPSQALPALPNGAVWNRAFLAEATFLYNVCDSSVGQVPVTFVDAKVDAIDKDWEAQKTTSPLIHRTLYGPKGVGVWDVNEMDGLPVGIQVVGGAWEEEKVLAMMGVVEAALAKDGKARYGPGKFSERKLASKA